MHSNGLISVNPTAHQRKWWAALAIVAFAFLSLRPACDVWLSHWDKHKGTHHVAAHQTQVHTPAHAPDEPLCCATVESGTLVKPSDAVVWRSDQEKPLATAAFVRTALWVAVPLLRTLTASVIPPGSPPFYVRSARILR
ncbi:MAG: hypothetical protein P8Y76_01615 [bacterium]|jgi:hypothetical protein